MILVLFLFLALKAPFDRAIHYLIKIKINFFITVIECTEQILDVHRVKVQPSRISRLFICELTPKS